MLRLAVAIVALLIACTGVVLLVRGELLWGWQALAGGLIVFFGTVYERWRYRDLAERPDGSWEATGERFVDPSTGDRVEVFYDPRTGERRYVSQEQSPPASRD